jgi:hypothetical protein
MVIIACRVELLKEPAIEMTTKELNWMDERTSANYRKRIVKPYSGLRIVIRFVGLGFARRARLAWQRRLADRLPI